MAREYHLVSGDAHLQVPADFWTGKVPSQFQEFVPKRVKMPGGGDAIVDFEGKKYFGATGNYSGHTPRDFDPMVAFDYDSAVGSGPPAQRLKEQDQDGVEAELLYPGTSAVHGIRVKGRQDAYEAMVRAYNDYLIEYTSEAPDRLFGVGMLPTGTTVADKIAEMGRLKKAGIKSIGLPGYPNEQPYPTPEDDPFWAAAIDLKMPLSVHTTMTRNLKELLKYPRLPDTGQNDDDPMTRYYRHANASRCGSLTVCQLLFAGVWDRFPKLNIYFAENNIGWIPFFLEQLDAEYEKNKFWAEKYFGLKQLDRKPSEYIQEHAYWGFYDDPIGIKMRGEIGVDHIVWGSDFPHVVSYWPESQNILDQQMAGVGTAERKKMQAENILGFLGIN
jgi:predicted TIM-barrel fold metal-dependent hydrolase